jgi:Dolichyl-phosphate-mannose-protein mannosyltransferase
MIAGIGDYVKSRKWIFYPIGIFLIFRIITLLWMWGIRQVFSQPIDPHPVLRPYLGVAIEQNPWLEPWQRWDTLHYQAIAERDYAAFDSALFVPPLFPYLMKAFAIFFGGNTLVSGIIISNIALLFSLIVFYRLTEKETQQSDGASRALLYLVSFPTSFFFFAAYTESLFLLASLLVIECARNEKWWQAGIWGGIASLTRLPGLLIVLALVYAAVIKRAKEKIWKPWISVILTLAGGAIFPLFIWFFLHLPLWTPLKIQEGRYQGGISFPGVNIVEAAQQILYGISPMVNLIDLTCILFFILCLIPIGRHLPRIYSVYSLSFMLFYLIRTSAIQPLLSIDRYVLVFFPAFMLMGIWGKKPTINRLILYISWIGLLYLSGQFAIWGWAG